MCFLVKTKRKMTAKKDIVCYKMFYSHYSLKSIHFDLIYRENELNEEMELQIYPSLDEFVIYQGYHSYKDIGMAIYYSFRLESNLIIRKCIIPKGSKYYVNDEQYVSSNIIVKEIL